MSQEDYPVDFVLDSINSAMAPLKQPKVILFDIGGVCVCVDIPKNTLEFWMISCPET